ncbi:EAL domain-containing protein [Methylococcus sp. EFPC2]|uniref:EAL domain-containing protein n=1 Tax=Methylococcus sp. EFPC2 TaxID=2812648 RepID=UPI00196779F9|nr:EAL domain-containing protein [Methylococcus sp. EFPC2]QSA96573.1 EAL domain-containing protein [Methylococcus sp. EFPC2]
MKGRTFQRLKRLFGLSVRRQLMLGIVTVHAVSMSLFVAGLVEHERNFLVEQSVAQVRGLAQTLATNSASWVLANDVSGLQEVLIAQTHVPYLRYAMLLSPQGRVIGHSEARFTGLYVDDPVSLRLLSAPPVSQVLLHDPAMLDIAEPVFANGKLIAWARVGVSQAPIARGLVEITQRGMVYAAVAIAIGALFAWFMAGGLTASLTELSKVAALVSKGQSDKRVRIRRNDELGAVGEAFNRMLDTLHEQAAAREAMQRQLARSMAEFEAMFHAIPDAAIVADPDSRIVLVNPATSRLFGYDVDELTGSPCLRIYSSQQAYLSVTAGPVFCVEVEYRRKDGSQFRGQLSRAPVLGHEGEHIGFISLIRDVSRQKEAELQLQLAAQVFESSREGIMITDAGQAIVMVNRAFREITGYARDEVVGRNPSMLSSGLHDQSFYQVLWQAVREKGHWQGEIWNRRRTGEIYPEWLSISAVKNDADEVINYVGLFSDISERKAAAEHIEFMATHDALTGLPNRMLLRDRIYSAVTQARRSKSPVAVLFVDLDRFKYINDTLGHQAGDDVLVEVAKRLRKCVREGDTVSRQGGDEFVVVLSRLGAARDARGVAQKILDAMRQNFHVQQQDVAVSPSIGISLYPQDGDDGERLIMNADAAMYHAKKLGRNNYQFYTREISAQALQRLSLESELSQALERGELLLHYQPQIDFEDGRIVGLEALLRWRHPEQGMIAPDAFIRQAEEGRQLVPLGAWVLGEACRQNKAWLDAGIATVPVAVNIIPAQFHHPDFLSMLTGVIQSSGLPESLLELEVAESALMDEHSGKEEVGLLRHITQLGIRLSIDDFGTGYSSLAYLKRLPVDKLKIGRSFVRDLFGDAEDAAIVTAIIELAHGLRLTTLAEGVDTREQYDRLKALGCNQLQGLLVCPPLSADEFRQWLIRGRISI